MRPWKVLAAAAAGVVLVPSGAQATTSDGPDLPDVSAAELKASVVDFDAEVHDIKAEITDLESRVEGSGGNAVSLNSDVLFGFDESKLSSDATKAVADVVKDIPRGAKVKITGYTDSKGSSSYNKKLSTDRAKAVEKAVAKARSDLDITSSGKGAANPVEPNESGGEDNPEGRAKNRRVEVSWSS